MKIAYLGWLRDKIGCVEEEVAVPAQVTNVGLLINWQKTRGARYEDAFEFAEMIKTIVNQAYVHEDQPVSNDDEVIFMPPIGGG
ncbi:MAG: MoaD/ThiS family protein [Gammaproteobacteria bacterium]|nr:MoaD/ThiS family protein [Gammaproteobacteria bacterium]